MRRRWNAGGESTPRRHYRIASGDLPRGASGPEREKGGRAPHDCLFLAPKEKIYGRVIVCAQSRMPAPRRNGGKRGEGGNVEDRPTEEDTHKQKKKKIRLEPTHSQDYYTLVVVLLSSRSFPVCTVRRTDGLAGRRGRGTVSSWAMKRKGGRRRGGGGI